MKGPVVTGLDDPSAWEQRMHRNFLLCTVFMAALALAGCPAGSTTLQTIPAADAGGSAGPTPQATPNSQENSGSGGSPVTVSATAGATFEAQLNQAFPDCEEVANAARMRLEIMNLVHPARTAECLLPVRHNQILEEQASQYACEMIAHDFFAHENPVTGSTLADRAREFGYRYLVIGENLAAGQPTPRRAFDDWMASPGHRANILDERFTELGLGIRSGGSFGMYWVQEFGRPANQPYTPSVAP